MMNYQGYSGPSSSLKQYLSEAELAKLRTTFNKNLNAARNTFKKRKFYRCRRGDIAAQEMITMGVNSTNEISYSTCMQRNQMIGSPSNTELLIFTYTHMSFLQMPTEQEAKEGFTKAFDEMFNTTFKSKLLNMNIFTHLSIGMLQEGNQGEVFKILCVLQKKPITVNVIATAESQTQGTCNIFVGQVFDQQFLPMLVVINKDLQSELRLGTANILYDLNTQNDQFKFWFYKNEVRNNPLEDPQIPKNMVSIDIYCKDSQFDNNQVIYGQGISDCSNVNPDQMGWILTYSDRAPGTIKALNISAMQALSEDDLQTIVMNTAVQKNIPSRLISRLQNGERAKVSTASTLAQQAVSSVTSTVNNIPRIGMTRAQQLKQQKTQEIIQKQEMNQSNNIKPAIALGYNNTGSNLSMTFNMGQQQKPEQKQSVLTFNTQRNNHLSFGVNNNLQANPSSANTLQNAISNTKIGSFQGFNSTQNNNQQFTNTNAQGLNFLNSSSNQSSNKIQTGLSFQPFQPSQTQNFDSNANKPGLQFSFKPMNTMNQNQTQFKNTNQTQTFQNNCGFQQTQQVSQPQQQSSFQPTQQQFIQPVQQPQQFIPPPQQNVMPPQLSFQFKPSVQQNQQQPQVVSPAPVIQTQPTSIFNYSPVPQNNILFPNNIQAPQQQMPLNLLSQYQAEMLNQFSPQELSHLHQMWLNNPKLVDEFLLSAHQKFQEQKSTLDQTQPEQIDWELKFKREVLYATDMGKYVLKLQESVNRVDDEIYASVMKEASISFQNGQKIDSSRAAYIILQKLMNKDFPNIIRADGFQRCYEEHKVAMADHTSREAQRCDLVLKLRDQKFICHQFVVNIGSKMMETVIKKNEIELERNNKKRNDPDRLNRHKLILPDWLSPHAMTLFIKYLYLGHLMPSSSSTPKPSFATLFDLVMLCHFFKHADLPIQLVFEAMLPEMSLKWAIFTLQNLPEVLKKHLPNVNINNSESLSLLHDYAKFFLALNLPSQLRTSRKELLDQIPIPTMSEVLQMSFNYIKGQDLDNRDVSILTSFAADVFGQGDIYKLLQEISVKSKKCTAFDKQTISQMLEFMLQSNPSEPYYCNLIESDKINLSLDSTHQTASSGSQNNKCEELPIDILQDKKSKKAEKTFIQEDSTADDNLRQLPRLYSQINLKSWKPKFNFRLDKNGNQISNEASSAYRRNAAFQVSLGLNDLRSQVRQSSGGKGTTYFSQAFDCARRSWHFKIDLDAKENMSVWIVERGLPISTQLFNVNSLTPNFSSVFMDIELSSKTIGNRNTVMFYSFAHNTNQVVGHKEFINLSQVLSGEELNFKVYITEFSLHSAVMHYLTDNFQKLFKQDYSELQSARGLTMFHLPFETVYQLLQSHTLRVEDENTVLGFLFHYIENMGLIYPEATTTFVCNLLVQSLRYNFMCFRKLLSALRRNQWLRNNNVFVHLVKQELTHRVKDNRSNQTMLLSSLDAPKTTEAPAGQYRRFYDMSLISKQGRNKLDAGDHNAIVGLLEETITWAITAAVITDNKPLTRYNREPPRLWEEEQRVKAENFRIQFEEERRQRQMRDREVAQLQSELMQFKRANTAPIYRPIMPSEQAPSTTRHLPKFLQGSNKENFRPQEKKNDTFEMSPPMKVPKAYMESQNADKYKMSADFSKVLKQLNLSPVTKERSFEFDTKPIECNIPRNPMLQNGYQMRTKIPTASRQAQDEGGCTIF